MMQTLRGNKGKEQGRKERNREKIKLLLCPSQRWRVFQEEMSHQGR